MRPIAISPDSNINAVDHQRGPGWAMGRWRLALLVLAPLLLAACTGLQLQVPDFTISAYQGEDELGGQETTLTDLLAQEKPVVLNFWAALCAPCLAEMPDIQKVYDQRQGEVLIVGIDLGPFVLLGTRDEGKALLEELDISYPAGTTFDEQAFRDLQILGMPTSIFLKPSGEVHRRWTGFLDEAKLNELIDELIAAS